MNWYEVAREKLGWIEVTLWYRTLGGYGFNHLELGHATGNAPTPRSDAQKQAWSGGRWSKKLWYAIRKGASLEILPEQKRRAVTDGGRSSDT